MMQDKSHPLEKGYVQVYTGNGKGKSTAALGLAFRAMGRGLRTYIGQFMKGQYYGELEAVKMVYPYITIEQYGKDAFVHIQDPAHKRTHKEDKRMAQEGLVKAKQAMSSGKYDIIVFDEITVAYHFRLVSLSDILDVVASKPERIEVVFTGRYAPPELIAVADLVSDIQEIKHYHQQGFIARDGIER